MAESLMTGTTPHSVGNNRPREVWVHCHSCKKRTHIEIIQRVRSVLFVLTMIQMVTDNLFKATHTDIVGLIKVRVSSLVKSFMIHFMYGGTS